MIPIPDGTLGREVDLGSVLVTQEMITAYRSAVGAPATGDSGEAPPTFCLSMRRGMTPPIDLPADMFGVYGGHDMEFHQPIHAGEKYRITGRITDVYEKMGRSGVLTVVVREAAIRDRGGCLVVRIIERQIVRQRPGSFATLDD